jgi:GYF domain 2/WG containing repeat
MQYYFINPVGQQSGPINPEDFKKLGIAPNTMVWCNGMDQWKEAQSIPELRKYFKTSFLTMPILIVYAVVMTIVFSLLLIPITALTASLLNTFPYFVPIPVLVLSVLIPLFFLIKKFRHLLRNAFFLTLPILISSIFSIIYFENCYRYENGYCTYYKNGNEGVLNKFGLVHLPCVYDELDPINAEGHEMNYWYGELPYRYLAKKDHYGLMTFSGEEIIPFKFDKLSIWREGETDVPLLLAENDNLHGLLTLDGEIALECEYTYICKKNETTGCSKINIGGSEDSDNNISGGKWGLIDKNGKLLVPCEYESILTFFSSGYIKARNDEKIDYYDFDGRFLRSEYDDY